MIFQTVMNVMKITYDLIIFLLGSFVCEYAGEVLTKTEALKRSSQKHEMNYIIVVQEHHRDKTITIVDPTFIGNVGRYANHSCEPNLVMHPVRIESLVPHLALFAKRDIHKGEELSFDYGDGGGRDCIILTGSKPCLCASKNCRGFLPFDKELYS